MATKRKKSPARRVAEPVDEVPATRIGNDDGLVDADGVTITFDSEGAFFMPERLRAASPAQREVMGSIQRLVRNNVSILATLDERVADARRLGLSWDSIGWLVGMSGRGAQKR